MKNTLFFLCLFAIVQLSHAQYKTQFTSKTAPFNDEKTQWADSLLQTMSIDEKIGQLFMVATYATSDKRENSALIKKLITKYHIGGLIFMQGTPSRQIDLLNEFQSLSKLPLLIGMDLENGLAFRLKNTESFPKNMTLGAITDNKLVFQTAQEIGRQCRRIGVNVNFAPVVDINNNRRNPIIGVRSFGEERENVAKKGAAFAEGLQSVKTIAVGKHFPGHGDTKVDSHQRLPILHFKMNRLDSLELYPFNEVTRHGISGMMTAHLKVPAIDSEYPSSLSKKAITLLRKKIGFEGLVFTDALNMGGVANTNSPGDVDLLALLAGNDVLLFSQNVPKAIKKIKKALKNGSISEQEIDKHLHRILLAKQWVGLQKWHPLSKENINEDLHTNAAKQLQEKLAKAAITLVKNDENTLPLQQLEQRKIAAVAIGSSTDNTFLNQLKHYAKIKTFHLPQNAKPSAYTKLMQQLKSYNTIIIAKHHNSYKARQKFGATTSSIDFISKITAQKDVIFTFFGSPYGLSYYNIAKCKAAIVAYEDKSYFQKAAAQAIFGGIAINGRLPLSINNRWPAGWGLSTEKTRLGYKLPDAKTIKTSLNTVDSILLDGIEKKAMPGCQFLLVKNGNIVYNKAYGHHTYSKKKKVKTTDIYDLASLTKVSATLPIIMQECDKGSLNLNTSLGEMFTEFANTDKAAITLEDLLTHESGLPSWIPLYKLLLDSTSYGEKLISYKNNKTYSVQIDNHAWIHKNFKYKKSIFNKRKGIAVGKGLFLNQPIRSVLFDTIQKVEAPKTKEYKYSDLGFTLCGEYLKKTSKLKNRLDTLYTKLGAKTTGMLIFKKYPLSQIVPTSKERFLRRRLVHGYVHDPNAALLGGVAGHAGLFSNAEDLAKIWQMYLQNGSYGGEQYIEPETIQQFTKQAHPEISRRGLGFDKPDADTTKITSFSTVLPLSTFGHTGFTGTMVWADPENKIIGILLSNRVYPNDWNNKMAKMDIRTKVQEAIYKGVNIKEE